MDYDRGRITRALDALTRGLYPYLEQEMQAVYRDTWRDAALSSFRSDRGQGKLSKDSVEWDAHAVLTVMWDQWNRIFRTKLKHSDRSLVSELREFRNRWAHQSNFDFDDTYRILDSVERLLKSIKSPQAEEVAREKRDLLRRRFSQEARDAYKKAQVGKQKRQDFSIYFFCCLAIDFVIFDYFGIKAWFFALFVVFVFAYLAYQRIVEPMQIYFGPHECKGCGKIIYGEFCPYCEKQPLPEPTRKQRQEIIAEYKQEPAEPVAASAE